METTATIDRIEGSYAILEVDDAMINWPLSALPDECAEGDVILFDIKITKNQLSDTEARLEKLKSVAWVQKI